MLRTVLGDGPESLEDRPGDCFHRPRAKASLENPRPFEGRQARGRGRHGRPHKLRPNWTNEDCWSKPFFHRSAPSQLVVWGVRLGVDGFLDGQKSSLKLSKALLIEVFEWCRGALCRADL